MSFFLQIHNFDVLFLQYAKTKKAATNSKCRKYLPPSISIVCNRPHFETVQIRKMKIIFSCTQLKFLCNKVGESENEQIHVIALSRRKEAESKVARRKKENYFIFFLESKTDPVEDTIFLQSNNMQNRLFFGH